MGVVVALTALAALGTPSADADTFSTPVGAMSGGQQVDASAVITTGNGTVTISLSNLLTAGQVVSLSQNLSELSFTLDTTASTGSVFKSTGAFINVGSGGAVTSASSKSGSASNLIGWVLSNSGSNYELNGLGALASPAQTIIGGTAGSFTAYASANSSIDGNGSHNPFVQGTGYFVLDIAGVTAATDITNVAFSFGTTPGSTVSAPEPSSLVLLGIGLLGFVGLVGRKLIIG
jgi:hypothetical protein